jgi:hypothetical protein
MLPVKIGPVAREIGIIPPASVVFLVVAIEAEVLR